MMEKRKEGITVALVNNKGGVGGPVSFVFLSSFNGAVA
jgi:hypothetical protein